MAKLFIEGVIGMISPEDAARGMKSFSSFDMQAYLEKQKNLKELTVDVNTNGGSVTHGYAIRHMLINLKQSGTKIHMIGHNVKSIGTVFFNVGDTRKVFRTTEFLAHNPWLDPAAMAGQTMEASDYAEVAQDLQAEEDKLLDTYAIDLNLTTAKKEELRALMKKNQNMSIEDVLAFGFATEIIDDTPAKNLGKAVAYSELIMAKYKSSNNMKPGVDKKEAKSLFDKIKAIGKEAAKLAGITEKNNASADLEDGTPIYYDGDLAPGTIVYTDDTMTTAAGPGDLILADGTTITLDDVGTITAVTPVNNTTTAGLKDQVAKLTATNAQLTKDLNAAKAANKTKDDEITALNAKNTEVANQVTDLMNSIEEMETKYFPEEKEKKPVVEKQAFVKDKKDDKPSRYGALKEKLNN